MKLLVFSDLQAGNWSQHSWLTSRGVNSRLEHCLSVFEQLKPSAVGADAIVFCGDLVEPVGEQETEVMARLYRGLEDLAREAVPIFMIPGNHDRAGQDLSSSLHALTAFEALPGVQVFSRPTLLPASAGVRFGFIPWQSTSARFYAALEIVRGEALRDRRSTKILFCHQALQGGLMCEEGYLPEDQVELPADAFEGFDAVFAGHLHRHHRLTRYGTPVWQVGAPLQHKRSDASDPGRGFLEVTLGAGKVRVERVRVDAPEFVDLVVSSAEALEDLEVPRGAFVYLRLSGADRQSLDQGAVRERLGVSSLVLDWEEPEPVEGRLAVRLGDSARDWVGAYVAREAPVGLDPEKLIRLMLGLMSSS